MSVDKHFVNRILGSPRLHRVTKRQHCFSFNMWVEIFGTQLLCLFFHNPFLTAQHYCNLFEYDLEEVFGHLPFEKFGNCYWQQDGALAHIAPIVHEFVPNRFQ